MKLLFVLDPLDSLKTYKDTSVAIMRAAAARGHDLFVCAQHDVFLRNAQVKIIAKKLAELHGEYIFTAQQKTAQYAMRKGYESELIWRAIKA